MVQEEKCDDSLTLYKYRDWDNNYHRSILIHNQLYFPLIPELNDPFDYQLNLSLRSINSDERIDYLLDLMLQRAKESGGLSLTQKEESEKRIIHKKLIKTKPELFLERYMKLVTGDYLKNISVLSLSEKWCNILMWAHYSNSHRGFCVGFDKAKLDGIKNTFDGDNLFGAHSKVHYSKEYPEIDIIKWMENNIETIFTESHTKSIDWNYECEYRYIRNWLGDKLTEDCKLIKFSDDIIKEVIVGLNISSDNEKEIQEICLKKNIPVYKIQKSNSQFILERKPL